MGPDAANLAASIARSHEIDRTPGATQRASEISQGQLAGESLSALTRKKANESDHLQREKIRHDRERRRREMERRGPQPGSDDSAGPEDSGPTIDVVV